MGEANDYPIFMDTMQSAMVMRVMKEYERLRAELQAKPSTESSSSEASSAFSPAL